MQGLWQGEENFPFGACLSLIDEFTHFCFVVCLFTRSLPLNCTETASHNSHMLFFFHKRRYRLTKTITYVFSMRSFLRLAGKCFWFDKELWQFQWGIREEGTRGPESPPPPTHNTYLRFCCFFFNYSTCQVLKFLELQNHILRFKILFYLIKHVLACWSLRSDKNVCYFVNKKKRNRGTVYQRI